MASLKTNVLLNLVNTFTSIIFPVITFPYATRVLGLDGIGVVNFYGSVVNYITLLSGIGIQLYAAKEVARYRDDIEKRNRITVEIGLLGLVFCVLGYLVVAALCLWVPRFGVRTELFLVLSLSIFFTAIGVNWFYQAIEDFRYITIRAIVFRLLTAASLFIFVRSATDLLAYSFVMVSLAVGNNFFNFIHLRKFISLRKIPWRRLRIWRHLRPTLKIFLPNLITSIYGNLNVVMLGFMATDAAVGVYSAGSKLIQIVLMVITSLSVVLMPRSANLLETGHRDEFCALSRKTARLVIAVAIPCMVGMMLLASPLIAIFCGAAFAPAAAVIRWTAPVLLFVGLSNLIGFQMLYPQGADRLVRRSLLLGVAVNFLLALWLIPEYSFTGAAIASLVAEAVVLVVMCARGRRILPLGGLQGATLRYALFGLLMVAVLYGLLRIVEPAWLQLVLGTAVGAGIYVLLLRLSRDELLKEMTAYARQLLKRK